MFLEVEPQTGLWLGARDHLLKKILLETKAAVRKEVHHGFATLAMVIRMLERSLIVAGGILSIFWAINYLSWELEILKAKPQLSDHS